MTIEEINVINTFLKEFYFYIEKYEKLSGDTINGFKEKQEQIKTILRKEIPSAILTSKDNENI